MMRKIVTPWSMDEPLVAQMPLLGSRKIGAHDRQQLLSRANEDLLEKLASVEFAPGELPVHILAIGSTEFFGPNRNGDGFRETVCRQYHPSFVKSARFFRQHKSGPTAPFYGTVKLSHYNERMHRIELVVGLFETAAAARRYGSRAKTADLELQKLASGQDIATSMGCTADPNTPVLTLDGYKPISTVLVGDIVLTHDGKWKPVTHVMQRQYTGKMIDLDVEGLPEVLPLTANHPMFAKSLAAYPALSRLGSRTAVRPVSRWEHEVEQGAPPFDWLCAEHLQRDDRIALANLAPHPDFAALGCTDFAQVLGTYIAEGCVQHCGDNPNTVNFTVNTTDWATANLPKLLKSLWSDLTVELLPKANCAVAFSLQAYSAELSRWMIRLVGHRVENKRLPVELYGASKDVKLAVMGRWLDGDGWCDKKGAHWSSANYGLVLQGRDVLASIGIPASIYKIKAQATKTGFGRKNPEYTLNVSNFDAPALAKFSQKVTESPWPTARTRTKPATLRQFAGIGAYRVKHVSYRDVEDVTVYNLEVADSHSYSMGGLASHNCLVSHDVCSHCGNKAKTPKNYCTASMCKAGGLRENMGKLQPDGSILHADNPDPDFGDISHVGRGADRISYLMGTLHKAASVRDMTIGGAELADMVYCPEYTTKLSSEANQLARLEAAVDQFMPMAGACVAAGRINEFTPPPGLDSSRKLAQALAALADQSIVLPVDEFVHLIAGAPRQIVSVKQAAAGIFSRLRTPLYNPFTYDGPAPSAYQAWAARLSPDYSFTKSAVQRRIGLASLAGSRISFLPMSKTAADNDLAEELAQHYGLYVLSALNRCSGQNLGLTAALSLLQNRVS